MQKTPDEIKKGLECDPLALIRQLYADNCRMTDELYNAYNVQNEQLERIQQLEAELDAALEDKRGECTYCAYLPGETISQTCFDCANNGFYRWEWCGVQKEE